jgi:hypothetical protein
LSRGLALAGQVLYHSRHSTSPKLRILELRYDVWAGQRWLTSVILATQEAENRRLGLKTTRANSSRNPILKKKTSEK